MDQLHRIATSGVMSTWGNTMLLAGLVVAVAACTSSQAESPPEDFVTVETGTFSLSHPADWEVLSQTEFELKVAAPGTEAVRPTAAVTVDDVYDDGVDGFETAVTGTLRVLNNIRQDIEELDTDAPDIPGAQRVEMVESTFATGEGVEVYHIDLFAIDGEGQLVYARAEAPRDQADPQRLRAIVSSLRL